MRPGHELTGEEAFLLEALSGCVNETPTPIPEGIDVCSLARLSELQNVSALLYEQTGLDDLRESLAAAAYHTTHTRELLTRLNRLFAENHISYFVFKGPETARYYPHPELRVCGDTDIMLRLTDKERAAALLEGLGFSPVKARSDDHEWAYQKGSLEIELHHRLLYDDPMNPARILRFTDTAWEHTSSVGSVRFRLEPEFHFVYLLLHIRKHFLWSGVGVRAFTDLAMMMKRGGLDFDRVGAYIEACGIGQFSRTCFAFVKRWFGVECPLGVVTLTEEFYINSTRWILSGGVFGNTSRDITRNNTVVNRARKYGRAGAVLRVLFPDRKHMNRKYPSRKKLPLPVLWCFRIFEALFTRSAGEGLSFAARHLIPEERDRKRSELLCAWGL